MSLKQPPRFARLLLDRLALDNEPLAGDLLEEFRKRTRSALWLWTQLVYALFAQAVYAPHPPVSLNLVPTDPVVAEWLMAKRLYRRRTVNLTGTSVEGVGGLTVVILCFVMTSVVPAVWWFVLAAIASGTMLGFVRLARARRTSATQGTPLELVRRRAI